MLRWGPVDGPQVAVASPLFEEANRTRAVTASICRALACLGVGSIVPDLPGQGESELATSRLRLADLRSAFASVPGTHVVAMRSGALLVDKVRPCWLLAPQSGATLLRELERIARTQLPGTKPDRTKRTDVASVRNIAGNQLSQALMDEFADASFPNDDRANVAADGSTTPYLESAGQLSPDQHTDKRRLVRLASDTGSADRHVAGQPPWRRAEPDDDLMLAQVLAHDIREWIAACES